MLFADTYFPTGSLSLAEVAAELNPETLQRLKCECGGLQTLLRNSHQVFEGKIYEVTIHCLSCLSPAVPPCVLCELCFLSPMAVILRGFLDVRRTKWTLWRPCVHLGHH